jgi:hypothetical protein
MLSGALDTQVAGSRPAHPHQRRAAPVNFLLWQSAYTEFVFLEACWRVRPRCCSRLSTSSPAQSPLRWRGRAADRLNRQRLGPMSEHTIAARRERLEGPARHRLAARLLSGLVMAAAAPALTVSGPTVRALVVLVAGRAGSGAAWAWNGSDARASADRHGRGGRRWPRSGMWPGAAGFADQRDPDALSPATTRLPHWAFYAVFRPLFDLAAPDPARTVGRCS